jgi:hypothetical protein
LVMVMEGGSYRSSIMRSRSSSRSSSTCSTHPSGP